MLKKHKNEPRRKVKKQAKVLPLLMLGAAAILVVFFYLNLSQYRHFSIDGEYFSVNESDMAHSSWVTTPAGDFWFNYDMDRTYNKMQNKIVRVDASEKEFKLDARMLSNRTWEAIFEESKKCALLCANCHSELHNPERTFENVQKSIDGASR